MSEFKVGQKVWDVVRGAGEVIRDTGIDTIIVRFNNILSTEYTSCGRFDSLDKHPSLYLHPVKIVECEMEYQILRKHKDYFSFTISSAFYVSVTEFLDSIAADRSEYDYIEIIPESGRVRE